MKIGLIIGGIYLLTIISCSWNQVDMDLLIHQMESDDSRVADSAIIKLYDNGENSICSLLNNAQNKKLYHGVLIYNPKLSQLHTNKVTVGVASLYLVEAIIRKDIHFALSPVLLYKGEGPSVGNSEIKLQCAERIYRKWLCDDKNLDLQDIREKKESLLSMVKLRWDGEYWNNK